MKLLTIALLACFSAAAQPYDLIIEKGRVIDGSGNPWFYGDVAIRGDRIVKIVPVGLLRNAEAKQRVDATGLVVAPGFIDIQAQSRMQLLNGDGRVISMVTQGVTTEIMGEGGSGGPSTAFPNPHGFDAWLRAMQKHGGSVNFGSFLGAATVREMV